MDAEARFRVALPLSITDVDAHNAGNSIQALTDGVTVFQSGNSLAFFDSATQEHRVLYFPPGYTLKAFCARSCHSTVGGVLQKSSGSRLLVACALTGFETCIQVYAYPSMHLLHTLAEETVEDFSAIQLSDNGKWLVAGVLSPLPGVQYWDVLKTRLLAKSSPSQQDDATESVMDVKSPNPGVPVGSQPPLPFEHVSFHPARDSIFAIASRHRVLLCQLQAHFDGYFLQYRSADVNGPFKPMSVPKEEEEQRAHGRRVHGRASRISVSSFVSMPDSDIVSSASQMSFASSMHDWDEPRGSASALNLPGSAQHPPLSNVPEAPQPHTERPSVRGITWIWRENWSWPQVSSTTTNKKAPGSANSRRGPSQAGSRALVLSRVGTAVSTRSRRSRTPFAGRRKADDRKSIEKKQQADKALLWGSSRLFVATDAGDILVMSTKKETSDYAAALAALAAQRASSANPRRGKSRSRGDRSRNKNHSNRPAGSAKVSSSVSHDTSPTPPIATARPETDELSAEEKALKEKKEREDVTFMVFQSQAAIADTATTSAISSLAASQFRHQLGISTALILGMKSGQMIALDADALEFTALLTHKVCNVGVLSVAVSSAVRVGMSLFGTEKQRQEALLQAQARERQLKQRQSTSTNPSRQSRRSTSRRQTAGANAARALLITPETPAGTDNSDAGNARTKGGISVSDPKESAVKAGDDRKTSTSTPGDVVTVPDTTHSASFPVVVLDRQGSVHALTVTTTIQIKNIVSGSGAHDQLDVNFLEEPQDHLSRWAVVYNVDREELFHLPVGVCFAHSSRRSSVSGQPNVVQLMSPSSLPVPKPVPSTTLLLQQMVGSSTQSTMAVCPLTPALARPPGDGFTVACFNADGAIWLTCIRPRAIRSLSSSSNEWTGRFDMHTVGFCRLPCRLLAPYITPPTAGVTYRLQDQIAGKLCVSRDGTLLAVGSSEGVVTVFHIPKQSVDGAARSSIALGKDTLQRQASASPPPSRGPAFPNSNTRSSFPCLGMTCVFSCRLHTGPVAWLRFHPRSGHLVSVGSEDDHIVILEMPSTVITNILVVSSPRIRDTNTKRAQSGAPGGRHTNKTKTTAITPTHAEDSKLQPSSIYVDSQVRTDERSKAHATAAGWVQRSDGCNDLAVAYSTSEVVILQEELLLGETAEEHLARQKLSRSSTDDDTQAKGKPADQAKEDTATAKVADEDKRVDAGDTKSDQADTGKRSSGKLVIDESDPQVTRVKLGTVVTALCTDPIPSSGSLSFLAVTRRRVLTRFSVIRQPPEQPNGPEPLPHIEETALSSKYNKVANLVCAVPAMPYVSTRRTRRGTRRTQRSHDDDEKEQQSSLLAPGGDAGRPRASSMDDAATKGSSSDSTPAMAASTPTTPRSSAAPTPKDDEVTPSQGMMVVLALSDGSVRANAYFSETHAEELVNVSCHSSLLGGATSVAVSPDCQFVVSAGRDGALLVLPCPPKVAVRETAKPTSYMWSLHPNELPNKNKSVSLATGKSPRFEEGTSRTLFVGTHSKLIQVRLWSPPVASGATATTISSPGGRPKADTRRFGRGSVLSLRPKIGVPRKSTGSQALTVIVERKNLWDELELPCVQRERTLSMLKRKNSQLNAVHHRLEKLKRRFAIVLDQNEALGDSCLSRRDLAVDERLINLADQKTESLVQQAKDNLHSSQLGKMLLRYRIVRECADSMAHLSAEVRSIPRCTPDKDGSVLLSSRQLQEVPLSCNATSASSSSPKKTVDTPPPIDKVLDTMECRKDEEEKKRAGWQEERQNDVVVVRDFPLRKHSADEEKRLKHVVFLRRMEVLERNWATTIGAPVLPTPHQPPPTPHQPKKDSADFDAAVSESAHGRSFAYDFAELHSVQAMKNAQIGSTGTAKASASQKAASDRCKAPVESPDVVRPEDLLSGRWLYDSSQVVTANRKLAQVMLLKSQAMAVQELFNRLFAAAQQQKQWHVQSLRDKVERIVDVEHNLFRLYLQDSEARRLHVERARERELIAAAAAASAKKNWMIGSPRRTTTGSAKGTPGASGSRRVPLRKQSSKQGLGRLLVETDREALQKQEEKRAKRIEQLVRFFTGLHYLVPDIAETETAKKYDALHTEEKKKAVVSGSSQDNSERQALQRALKDMMGGSLQGDKSMERSQRALGQEWQPWMLRDEETLSDKQKKMLAEFNRKEKALHSQRWAQITRLRADLKKLQNELNDLHRHSHHEVTKLGQYRRLAERDITALQLAAQALAAIVEQNRQSQLEHSSSDVHEAQLREEEQRLNEHMRKGVVQVDEAMRQLDALRTQEKQLDRKDNFRREFSEVSEVADVLYQLYKAKYREPTAADLDISQAEARKRILDKYNSRSQYSQTQILATTLSSMRGGHNEEDVLETVQSSVKWAKDQLGSLNIPQHVIEEHNLERLQHEVWEAVSYRKEQKMETMIQQHLQRQVLEMYTQRMEVLTRQAERVREEINRIVRHRHALHERQALRRLDALLFFVLKGGLLELEEGLVSTLTQRSTNAVDCLEVVKAVQQSYADGLVIRRSTVDELNKRILSKAAECIEVRELIRDFRKGNNVLRWKHEFQSLELEDQRALTQQLQLLRVTKSLQRMVTQGGHLTQQAAELEKLERKVSFARKNAQNSRIARESDFDTARNQLDQAVRENTRLQKYLTQLQFAVARRRQVNNPAEMSLISPRKVPMSHRLDADMLFHDELQRIRQAKHQRRHQLLLTAGSSHDSNDNGAQETSDAAPTTPTHDERIPTLDLSSLDASVSTVGNAVVSARRPSPPSQRAVALSGVATDRTFGVARRRKLGHLLRTTHAPATIPRIVTGSKRQANVASQAAKARHTKQVLVEVEMEKARLLAMSKRQRAQLEMLRKERERLKSANFPTFDGSTLTGVEDSGVVAGAMNSMHDSSAGSRTRSRLPAL